MKQAYRNLQKLLKKLDSIGPNTNMGLLVLFRESCEVLNNCTVEQLNSRVVGKEYFSYQGEGGKISRPINKQLVLENFVLAEEIFANVLAGQRHSFNSELLTRSIYTVAIACCAGNEIASNGAIKTSGTIFEWICASIAYSCFRVVPVRKLPVFNLDIKIDLPTDFIFDLGIDKPKFHLPAKTSTRERVVQVWAHQRVLDGVYGSDRFLGMPMILAETKLDAKSREVIEICLPNQWRLYQMHISRMWNICYFDAPTIYLELDRRFPKVPVCTIGELLVKGGRLDTVLENHGIYATAST